MNGIQLDLKPIGRRRRSSPALLVACLFGTVVLVAGYQRIRLEHFRMQSKQLEQNVASETELLRMRESLDIPNRLASAFIPPSSGAQAEAALIAQFRRLLLNANAEIRSIEITKGANTSIENDVRLHASVAIEPLDLDRLIQTLSEHQPYLFVTSAKMRSTNSAAPNQGQYGSDLVEVELTLEAFRRLEND